MPTRWLLAVAIRPKPAPQPDPALDQLIALDLTADTDAPLSAPRDWLREVNDLP